MTSLVIDTKWKRLSPYSQDRRNGVSQADLYQLYAYAERYECADNVLLYPKVRGVDGRHYQVDGGRRQSIRIETVNVNRDIYRDRRAFKEELFRILVPTEGKEVYES